MRNGYEGFFFWSLSGFGVGLLNMSAWFVAAAWGMDGCTVHMFSDLEIVYGLLHLLYGTVLRDILRPEVGRVLAVACAMFR